MELEITKSMNLLEHLPKRIQNYYMPFILNGDMRVAHFHISKREIVKEQMMRYREDKDYYDSYNMTPSYNGVVSNMLRQKIKAKHSEWCEVRTTPSKAFSSWWKKGNDFYILIKRRYARLPL